MARVAPSLHFYLAVAMKVTFCEKAAFCVLKCENIQLLLTTTLKFKHSVLTDEASSLQMYSATIRVFKEHFYFAPPIELQYPKAKL